MFRVKVCGITRTEDAIHCEECGVDAIGFNFYQRSARFVAIEDAKRIVAATSETIAKVGVFVNAELDFVRKATEQVPLDYVQLHGDETAAFAAKLEAPIIRAIRCRDDWREQLATYLRESADLGRKPVAILLDAYKQGEYGGTGEVLDWNDVQGATDIPLVLAGGLTPINVEEAVKLARPNAVDTASGVEDSPGRKNQELIRAFCANARNALQPVDQQ